ncbi:MAG: WD40/YVTN/BNR-like repeat-containing protein, partial [Nitrospirales bacterium]
MILVIAIGFWLVYHSRSPAPRSREHWNARTSGTPNILYSIFGTSDGKRLWAVGSGGTILESDDGEHWYPRASGTREEFYSIFGTSDGKRLWVVGDKATILESDDGEHWNALTSGIFEGLH